MKNGFRKAVFIFISLALLLLVVFCGWQMVASRNSSKEASEAYAELAEKVGGVAREEVQEAQPEETDDVEEPGYPQLDIDIEALKEMNGDFRGWMYFPALDISYPVVQGEDNDYYLKHSFEGEKVNAGCIFMDYGASADWSDRNTFIFGHNMRDGSMFGTLKKLMEDTSICEENPYFYIYTEDYVYTYEIFSYYETKSTSDRYMTFTSDASYDAYVEWAVENSKYVSIVDLSERKNIVSLSTCYGSAGTNRRILVHGVLTSMEEYN